MIVENLKESDYRLYREVWGNEGKEMEMYETWRRFQLLIGSLPS